MSLNFDFTGMIERLGQEEYDRITNHPDPDRKEWHPVTNALIWACLYIDMPGIDEKNADEFADRLTAYQAASGPLLATKDGSIYITAEDVKRHIGLRTNVTKRSKTAFNAKLVRLCVEAGKRAERLQEMSAFDLCAKWLAEAGEVSAN